MASIKQIGSNYKITVSNGYDVDGKKIRETTTFAPDPKQTPKQQQKALEKFAYEFEQKVKDGKLLKGEKITFKEFTDRWLVEYGKQQLQPTTYNGYVQDLTLRILPAIGHLKLSSIKPMHLLSFYNNLTEDGVRLDGKKGGYGTSTIRKCHAVISTILSTAVQWQLIESNPCDRVSPPKSKELKDNVKCFTLEESERFLKAIEMEYTFTYQSHDRIDDTGIQYHVNEYQESKKFPTQLKIFFYMALFGGLRRGELIALTWDDIDFDSCSVRINKSTIYTNKETITKSPKNKTSIRVIKIPETLISMLKSYGTEQKKYRLSIGDQWSGDNYIFIQWNGSQMNPSTPYQSFKRIIKNYNATVKDEKLKLPDIPLHGLRHTSATLLISENVDVRTVSARLGHAQTSTTMNIYAHSLAKLDEKAANTFENMFYKSM